MSIKTEEHERVQSNSPYRYTNTEYHESTYEPNSLEHQLKQE